jgi:NAD(P)-dependent dehydrogenase (short-subunit alcohol dehydrogenase family)
VGQFASTTYETEFIHDVSTGFPKSGIADWQPMGRQGMWREIGCVADFLASDDSSFMTGSAVVADGGTTPK